jgi:ABC-2 type transport system permease protein
MILKKYGVSKLEDLPVDYRGESLLYAERLSTETYREYYFQLYALYRQQTTFARAFTLISPLVPLKSWSAALARTDFPAHQRFLDEAEAYRYRFVQTLNDDIRRNRSHNDKKYVSDVAHVTASIPTFEPSQEPLPAILHRQWPDAALLMAWLIASVGFALWSAERLRHGV